MFFYVSSGSGVVAVSGLAVAVSGLVIIASLLLCVVAMAVIQLQGPRTYKQRMERTMINLYVNIIV